MCTSVTYYPILKCMLSYTNDQQLHHYGHLTCIRVRLMIFGKSMFNNVIEVYAYVKQWATR